MKSVEATKTTATNADDSFVIKCLLKTVRFMWQVTELPGKIGETLGTLYRYAQDSVDSILCIAGKARRKERDGEQNATDTKLYLEESVLERKLPEADLKALVDLPAGLDYNEWLASHTLALFEHVNLVYGTISEFCTPTGCPDMTGPGNRTYLWFDEKGKKTRVAAPQYIDYVMTFTQKTVSDESIFPTKYANEFPSSFESIARKILRLQFHVIAHLYAAHFREIALLGLHTHLNLTFAHLTALHRRFTLIDEKETDVLRDLEVALRLTDDSSSSSGAAADHETHTMGVATAAAAAHHCSNATQSLQPHQMDDVNSVASNAATASAAAGITTTAGTTLIDGDAAAPPICTQPEAATKAAGGGGGGGGGGLIGGILGDLTTGEFGDTTRYCTSALPTSAAGGGGGGLVNNCSVNCNATPANCNACAAAATGDGSNNTNHNHHPHHHHHGHGHHHHHHHGHHHHNNHQPQQHQYQHAHASPHHPNSGLIQCNASTAPATMNASAAAAAAAELTASTAATTTA